MHGVLLVALLFGGLFRGDRIPEAVSVSQVTTISEEEFAALVLPGAQPEPQTEAPDAPPPEAEEAAPEAPQADTAPVVSEPEEVEVPEAPDTSQVETPQPLPDAVAVDTEPPVPAAPSELDGTSLEQDAVAAPAPRVAPIPQVAPPPEAERAPEVVPDTAPDPAPAPEPEPEPEAPSSPEEASDRIVTEAEEVETYAPASSMRPRSRPPMPVRRAETPRAPTPEPEPQQPSTDDAVTAALSESQSDAPAPTGPPLTGGEKDAFRVAVGDCWVVDSGGQSSGVIVTVAFEMNRDGTVAGDVRLVSAQGGNDAAQRTAFEKARRAILRCQRGGYGLPVDKYEQWREIEATFNPQGMQYR